MCLSIYSQNRAPVNPVAPDNPSDVSAASLEFICGKLNGFDRIWRGKHFSK